MNPQIKIKALYESRRVFRGIQHFIASPSASNTLIIFVILTEGNSQFGPTICRNTHRKNLTNAQPFSKAVALYWNSCGKKQKAASSAIVPVVPRKPHPASGQLDCLPAAQHIQEQS